MTAMSSYDILQLDVLCTLRQIKVGYKWLACEEVGILLTYIIYCVNEWQHVSVGHRIAADGSLLELQFNACQITLVSPCVDEYAHVSLAFKLSVAVGDVLLPLNAIRPLRNVYWAALCREFVVLAAEMSYTEWSHKSHQLNSRQIVLAGYDTDELLVL